MDQIVKKVVKEQDISSIDDEMIAKIMNEFTLNSSKKKSSIEIDPIDEIE